MHHSKKGIDSDDRGNIPPPRISDFADEIPPDNGPDGLVIATTSADADAKEKSTGTKRSKVHRKKKRTTVARTAKERFKEELPTEIPWKNANERNDRRASKQEKRDARMKYQPSDTSTSGQVKRSASLGLTGVNEVHNRETDDSMKDDTTGIQPGAIPVAGFGGEQQAWNSFSSRQEDNTYATPDTLLEPSSIENNDESTLNVIATLVDDDLPGPPNGDAPFVVATKDDNRCINFKDRRVRIWLSVVCILIIAMAISLGVALSVINKNSSDRENGSAAVLIFATNAPSLSLTPSVTPTLSPTASFRPTGVPTTSPSTSLRPSLRPTSVPSESPQPSVAPSQGPSLAPSLLPSVYPSSSPTSLEWTQIGQNVTAPGSFQNFGSAVTLSGSGTRLAIGTPQSTNTGSTGNIYVFEQQDENFPWVTTSAFPIEGDAPNDEAGRAVSMSEDGSRMAVGYPFHGVNQTGLVRVFDYDENRRSWVQIGSDMVGDSLAIFGYALSLSRDGRRLAVTTNHYLADQYDSSTLVKVYGFDGNLWNQIGATLEKPLSTWEGCEQRYYGASAALSADGSRIAVVDYGDEDVTLGFLRVFEFDSTADVWTQVGTTQDGGYPLDYLGSSLSISDDGTVVAVAGLRGGGYADGIIMAYRFNSTTNDWMWVGTMENGENFLVRSVSLSGDGSRIAVQEAEGIVRVCDYDVDGAIWRQVVNEIDAAGVPEFRFDGEAVSLSSDGMTLAIGAPEVGIVRVFRLLGV